MLVKLRNSGDQQVRLTDEKLIHLEKRLFYSYEPSQLPNPDFTRRLVTWIDNFSSSEKDAATMFHSITELFYVGREEFKELYKYAYNGQIARWLIDKNNIQLDDPDAHGKLKQAECETWFCPITDSMQISSFCHVNLVSSGTGFRPEWRSLAKFGDIKKIKDFCLDENIKNLVLLEDFVGGGSQIGEILNFLSNFQKELRILIAPLIICQNGVDNMNPALRSKGIDFAPILKLNHTAFISEAPQLEESELTKTIRNIANNIHICL